MDHGGDAASPTTVVEFTELVMAGAVEAHSHMSTGTFHVQRGAAAARRAIVDGFEPSAAAFHDFADLARHVVVPVDVSFHLHHQPEPGVAYPNIGEFWRQQMGLVDVALLGPHLPDEVVHSYGYSFLQPRPRAGRGVVLVDLLPGGGRAVYNGDYALQPRPDAGHGEVLVDLLPVPDGVGHGEAFVGQLPGGGGGAAYGDYGYYALQPLPGAGHGQVLVDLLPDGTGHGEVFVGLLPGGGGSVHDYGYYPWQWQPRPGVGSDEVFIGPLPDGVGAVFVNSGSFAPQTLAGTGRADGIAGALRVANLGAGYDGSVALAHDLGAGYDNRGMVADHLRRLLPFVGIGASCVAVNGLAAGPGSPAVAFHLFMLLLGGLFLVILHVLRV
ncbi:unnamed protein product [Miscanthus lutarioriparius]|uniref:Uncharacterized protein n=1 Tax=Miscanthus lutarioriparius TaxID=422564 RepID=A0A811PTL3_9POAL|nr:unnamed protein product [Miscanthus lutarioriparius]